LKLYVAWQLCVNVMFCLSRFSCLTDHGLCVVVKQILCLLLDVWTLFSFDESNI